MKKHDVYKFGVKNREHAFAVQSYTSRSIADLSRSVAFAVTGDVLGREGK